MSRSRSRPFTTTHSLLAGVHVLVIDDEGDAREFVGRMLEDQGAVVTTAGSASEGFTALLSARPDVVVGDIGMPNGDGIALITRVRKSGASAIASIPALAVTAYARDQDRQQALLAGFQSHLAKPFAALDLVTIVRQLAHSNDPLTNAGQTSKHS
jgi:CheY-like chemotaxis protein